MLDKDVEISGDKFITKVYCKTDNLPFNVISLHFVESNMNGKLYYLVFYGQILRFQRLCMIRSDFEDRTRFLVGTLMNRKFDKGKLMKEFCRVIGKYLVEFQKWQIPINIPHWF